MDLEFEKSAHNFLQKLGEIIKKYDQDFTLVSDIVDLNTGLLDVDNGHLRKLCLDSSLLQNGYFPEAEEVEEGEDWAETYIFDHQHHPLPLRQQLGQQLGHYRCQLQCQKRENKYELSSIIGRIASTPNELEEEEDIWENSLYSLQNIYAKKLKKQKLASSPIIAAKDTSISASKVNTLKKQQVELLDEPNVVVLLSDDEDSLIPLPSSTILSSTTLSSAIHSSVNTSLVVTAPMKAPPNSIGTVSQQPQQLPRKDQKVQEGQDEWDPPVESFILA